MDTVRFLLDYSINYSPVDITYHILVLLVIIYRYNAKIVDVKTAFFIEIWMNKFIWSVFQVKKTKETKSWCLTKALMGLFRQPADLKQIDSFKKVGIHQRWNDMVSFFCMTSKGTDFISFYVDNILMIEDHSLSMKRRNNWRKMVLYWKLRTMWPISSLVILFSMMIK